MKNHTLAAALAFFLGTMVQASHAYGSLVVEMVFDLADANDVGPGSDPGFSGSTITQQVVFSPGATWMVTPGQPDTLFVEGASTQITVSNASDPLLDGTYESGGLAPGPFYRYTISGPELGLAAFTGQSTGARIQYPIDPLTPGLLSFTSFVDSSPAVPAAGEPLLVSHFGTEYEESFVSVRYFPEFGSAGTANSRSFDATNGSISVVPEPTSFAVFGLLGLLGMSKRRRRAKNSAFE